MKRIVFGKNNVKRQWKMKRNEKIRELERDIGIWKRNQEKRPEEEEFFHYTQKIIDRLESELDIVTRVEN